MKFIQTAPNGSGAYPPIQEASLATVPEGCALVPEDLDTSPFYKYMGFVSLTIRDGVVTALEPNEDAYAAWLAEHPPEDPDAALAAEVRAQRDKLLAETDWTQVLDAPVSAALQEEYRNYRQALRDVPEQPGFPEEIVWPELPAAV